MPEPFIPRDPNDLYSHDEIVDLLVEAHRLGFSLEPATELEKLSIWELDVLVHRRQ